jgi:hypothetical protein
VKKWLFNNQGFLPLIQSLLETMPQPTTTRALQVEEHAVAYNLQVEKPTTACAFQVRTAQSSLGTPPGTTHIHSTHLIGVRG